MVLFCSRGGGVMRRNICSRSISVVIAAVAGVFLSITLAIAGSALASDGNSIEPTTLPNEAPEQIVLAPEEMPLDAFGYVGGLLEARFYEPHSTTGDPGDEIRQAASLYGVDLAMMMAIAKVESNFKPRARTGSFPPPTGRSARTARSSCAPSGAPPAARRRAGGRSSWRSR